MGGLAILSLALLVPTAAPSSDRDAQQLAQDILTKGAARFDTRDAAAMATTYTEHAEVTLLTGGGDTGKHQVQSTRGRAAIGHLYRKLFEDRKEGTTSRNAVEFAHFIGPDLLVIHGTFTADVSKGGPISFVQVRAKEGEHWLIVSLQLFLVAE
jgi:hypothetical protein